MITIDETAEKFLQDLKDLVKEYPNDQILGKRVRELIGSIEGLEEDE